MSIFSKYNNSALDFFGEICKIPHGSGNEVALSNYIKDFADKRNLYVNQDELYNVIIKKPATCGKENIPPVILQAHIDMVCEKNNATVHNFLTDPLKLRIDGDFIKATGTTLGADNGIAVAFCLALLDSSDIAHPSIEVVFTTSEETGMDGAKALNTGILSAKRLINIDSEDEGIFCVSCAGGLRAVLSLPIASTRMDGNSYEINVTGLKGGHSGMDIIKNRANANKVLGRVLFEISSKAEMYISEISGGAKDNAIPREASARITIVNEKIDLYKLIENINCTLQSEFSVTEPNICISCNDACKADVVFDKDTTFKVISILNLTPNGVIATIAQQDLAETKLSIENMPETSNNLGIVQVCDNKVVFTNAIRSSVISRLDAVSDKVKILAELTGADFHMRNRYPAWEYNRSSQLKELFLSEYKDLYGKCGETSSIHAGLECGLFAEKISGVDMISFGPDIFDVHTPDERLCISSTIRTWDFLCRILDRMV